MTAIEQNSVIRTKNSHSIWARLGAEFAGSLLICFAIYMMCTVGTVFYNINMSFIALGTGVVYAAMTAIFAKISGGQFNPAITLAAMLTSKTKVGEGIGYIIAQVIGALCAGGLFRMLLPTSEYLPVSQWLTLTVNGYDQGTYLYTSLSQMGLTYSLTMAMVVEVLASIIVIAAAMQTMKSNGSATRSHAITMGIAYAAATAFTFPITGAAINPARATGIAVASIGSGLTVNPLKQVWVFWVSAILAAAIVALVIIVAQLLRSKKGADIDPAEAVMLNQEDQAELAQDEVTVSEEAIPAQPLNGFQADEEYSVVEQEDAQVEQK